MEGFLGPEREEWEHWICGHLPHRGADAIACSQDAVWHGFALDDAQECILAMMSCCDEHLPEMKLSADYVHPHEHPCGVPGSWFWWPENKCRLDWDDAELLTAEREMAGTASE